MKYKLNSKLYRVCGNCNRQIDESESLIYGGLCQNCYYSQSSKNDEKRWF